MALPVCIIVGYGPGNGQGIARAFGRAGFSLGLLARSPGKLSGPLAELEAAGYAAELIAADAGDEQSLTAGLGTARDRLGDAEVLVYNAVAFRWRRQPPSRPINSWPTSGRTSRALVAANFVLPAMKARRSGAVLFTGGGWALYPSAAVASTAIGKAGTTPPGAHAVGGAPGSGVRAGTVTIMGLVAAGTAFDPTGLVRRS